MSSEDRTWAVQAVGALTEATAIEAACVTAVTGSSEYDVLRAFGAGTQTMSVAEAALAVRAVAVVSAPGGVVAVEFNGFQGTLGSVMKTASLKGRAASAFWNVNAVTDLIFAEKGHVLASIEAGRSTDTAWGERPAILDDLLRGLAFGAEDCEPNMIIALQRFTGIMLTHELVSRIERVRVICSP